MGRAFQIMQKQVAGRRAARMGYVGSEERIRNLEVALLEVLAFIGRELAVDGDKPSHHYVTEAAANFKATLERVLGK